MFDESKIIKQAAETGKPVTSSGRSNKFKRISFDNLIFVPAQLSKRPVDFFREEISTETIIGKNSKKPLKLKTPVLIAAMSFGALSKEAKKALADASTITGTATNTGEGGMLPEERELSERLIIQYSTGRFGISEEILKKAEAIEIKIGQGAKPAMGGLLPQEKVTEEIAQVRKVERGKDIQSPAYHPDIKSIDDLKKKIEYLRELTKVPIILKLGACEEEDVKLAVKANPDAIAIDGMEGGTAAAPKIMLDDFGVPTLSILVKARKVLDKLGAKQELLIGGGLEKGSDVAKALALGADAVFMGSSLMVAMGCLQCGQCHKGKCPVGITTQEKEMRKKFNIEEGARKASNFIRAYTKEVQMVAGACGYNNIHSLNTTDLRAIDLLTSKITEIPLV